MTKIKSIPKADVEKLNEGKAPRRQNVGYLYDINTWYRFFCPTCDKNLDGGNKCLHCGQKIDYSL